jgi:hypothetical protein
MGFGANAVSGCGGNNKPYEVDPLFGGDMMIDADEDNTIGKCRAPEQRLRSCVSAPEGRRTYGTGQQEQHGDEALWSQERRRFDAGSTRCRPHLRFFCSGRLPVSF